MTINLDLLTEYEVSLAKPHYGRCKLFGTDELKMAGCTCASIERDYLIRELATARAENKQFSELLTGYFAAKSKGIIYSTAGDGMDNYMNKIAALLQEKEIGK